MSTPQFSRRLLSERTPGERAFDRVLLNIKFYFLLASVPVAITASDANHASLRWVSFGVGVIGIWFWISMLRGVLLAWHDPSARVLRFSSLLLLVVPAVIVLWCFRPFFL